MDERKEKSIFRLLPSYVWPLEKFTLKSEIRNCLDLFGTPMALKTCSSQGRSQDFSKGVSQCVKVRIAPPQTLKFYFLFGEYSMKNARYARAPENNIFHYVTLNSLSLF